MLIDAMIENHRELVEVGQEHNDEYDSFIDDETNWIFNDDEQFQPKTGTINNKYMALSTLCEQQSAAIATSHEQISALASHWEDSGDHNAAIDHKFAAFFSEFGV